MYRKPCLVDATVQLLGLLYVHGVIYKIVMKCDSPDPVGLSGRLRHCFLEVCKPAQDLHSHGTERDTRHP